MPRYRYRWPSSALTPADMAILYAARKSAQPRTPITELIAKAIRTQYAVLQHPPPAERKSA